MTTQMQKLFQQFGLKRKEKETFLKLLELGAQPVSVIAKQIGIPRSSMYLVIENLRKSQLIEAFERAGIKYVKCIPIKNIPDILKIQERQIKQTLKELNEKIPELEKLENRLSITPKVKFFEGKNAVMKMYEEVLREKEFCAFFNPHLVKKIMPEYHFKIPETLKKNGGKAKELLVNCSEAKEYQNLFNSKNHQIKILDKNTIFPSDTIICQDKIYMISYGEKDLSAIEIFNSSLAQTQRILFDEIWEKS